MPKKKTATKKLARHATTKTAKPKIETLLVVDIGEKAEAQIRSLIREEIERAFGPPGKVVTHEVLDPVETTPELYSDKGGGDVVGLDGFVPATSPEVSA